MQNKFICSSYNMANTPQQKVIPIDAAGKAPGRLASEVVHLLRGKDDPSWQPHIISNVRIDISNIDKMNISEKKLEQEFIYTFSGYPSGQKKVTWKMMMNRGPEFLFRTVLKNMLPDNKHRAVLMKKVNFV